jgi:hypothetical protein
MALAIPERIKDAYNSEVTTGASEVSATHRDWAPLSSEKDFRGHGQFREGTGRLTLNRDTGRALRESNGDLAPRRPDCGHHANDPAHQPRLCSSQRPLSTPKHIRLDAIQSLSVDRRACTGSPIMAMEGAVAAFPRLDSLSFISSQVSLHQSSIPIQTVGIQHPQA